MRRLSDLVTSSRGQNDADHIVRQFIERCADVVMTLDHAGRIGQLEAAAVQALDLQDIPKDEDRLWSSLWNVEPAVAAQGFQTAVRNGRSCFEASRRTASMKLQWWHVTIFAVSAIDAPQAVLIVLANDITARIAAAEARNTSEQCYRALVLCGRTMTWSATADGTITEAWGWDEIFGASSFEARRKWVQSVHPEDSERVAAHWKTALDEGVMPPIEFRLGHPDGRFRWVQSRGLALRDAGGTITEWLGSIGDIHDLRSTAEALRENEERLNLALDAARMFAWERQLGETVTTRSASMRNIVGLDPADTKAAVFLDRVHDDDRANLIAFMDGLLPSVPGVFQFRFHHPDGHEMWLETSAMLIEQPGARIRMFGVTSDITDSKAAERTRLIVANHDALTGLLNRSAIQAKLGRAIKNARRTGTKVALILLDIDHFKDVNDTLGHDAGDALLKITAEHLKAVIGRDGAVARLGGDEFAIVMPGMGPDDARHLGLRILESLAKPIKYRGKALQVKASVGIAVCPDHDEGRLKLLKDADLALYAAKNGGRNQVSVYDSTMRLAVESRMTLAAEIEAALDADWIVPFYQPKVDLATGAIIGFEALARWIHPVRGISTPDTFAAAFKDPHLAVRIDEAMSKQVMRDIASWHAQGLDCGRIALNLSTFAFRTPSVARAILDDLAAIGLSPRTLEIEVTETVFLDDRADMVAALLSQFREAGMKISLDDFGTGYASLTHLKQFPVDAIKIDRSFIRDVEDDPQDAVIVSAVIGLANALGLGTVAEGIETEGQAAKLRQWGCVHGQGYLYAKPMAASRVPWLLTQTFPPLKHEGPTAFTAMKNAG